MVDDSNKVSLKEYILALLKEHDRQHELIARALDTANEGLTQKQQDANEWRATVGDFRDKTVSRKEFDEYKTSLLTRLNTSDKAKSKLDGSILVIVFLAATAIPVVVTLIMKSIVK